MAVQVTIGGTDHTTDIVMGSLKVTDNLNQEVDTCNFSVKKYGSKTFTPTEDLEIIVTVDGTREYGGVIVEADQSINFLNEIVYDVQAKDFTHFLDRRMVTERYTNQTINYIVSDLISRYASDLGFTTNHVQGQGFTISSISFSDIPLSECFQKIAQQTNYLWYVDYFKDIHFIAKNDEAAPFSLTDTSGTFIYDSLKVKNDFTQIRNKVKVRGAEAVSSYRTEPHTGDGVTDTFALSNKFSQLPDVTVNGVTKAVGVDYLNKDSDFDVMWSFEQKYLRFTAGHIPPASLDGSGNPQPNIVVGGTPYQPVVVQIQDNASVAAHGVYEFSIRDDTLKSRDQAIQYALAQLSAYANTIQEGNFDTMTPGLQSGQTLTINSTARGINEQFIIQSVAFTMNSPTNYFYQVQLATLKTLSIIDFLQQLLRNESITVDADETLLNFLQLDDDFSMTDGITRKVTTTTQNYVWEQSNPGSDSYSNPIVWNEFTWSS